MQHAFGWAAALTTMIAIGASAPAQAQAQRVFGGVTPTTYLKKWSANEWKVWAMPDGSCLALAQDPEEVPFHFWGFRQVIRSKIDLVFGSFEHIRPRTLQMSFNDGGHFDYPAKVVQFVDWNAYSVTLQGKALAVFHDQTIIEAFTGDTRIFVGITNSTRNLEKKMNTCLEWQRKP